MPPVKHSRHQYTIGLTNTAGETFLTDPVPVRYIESSDTIVHVVQEGERMENIAHRYYSVFETPTFPVAGLAWIIRDFQPVPIIDPTLKLKAGTKVYVPAPSFVQQRVFDERRRDV